MAEQALLGALQQHFGFDSFRPGQLDAMRRIVERRDTLVVMPTGAGKSLCFQLPAMLNEGTTLVISPLIALMKDQVDALQSNGIEATFINSSLEGLEQSLRLDALARGRYKLCYIAPERLRNQSFREAALNAQVDLLVVDEAHCISQWGHDFRPEYRSIGDFVEALGRPSIAALTATATPQVQEDIEKQLSLNNPYRLVTGFNRPNLRFDVSFTPGETLKQTTLRSFLSAQEPGACGVIYVGRRREADDVADFVRAVCGRSAVCYHGGMPGWERESVQNDWMSGRASVVVATNAFGMGVDKPDVRFVVHYTVPGTLEAYYQEAGRAGRDGNPSHCLVLLDPSDARLHEWFIENDAPSLEELRALYAHIRDEGRRGGGRVTTTPSHLASVLDWKGDGKARMGMKLLEQAGLLEDQGEQGGMGRWRLLDVRGRVDMDTPMREVEQRRALKRRLLNRMLDYAQTHDCRRQYLLDYFGDATPPVADWCCDNCHRRQNQPALVVATSPDDKRPLLVLDAVNNLAYGVGRALLAKILTGSRASNMSRYFEHPQFGILRHLSPRAVQTLIDELIRERYLRIEPGQYPTLALSASGQQAVEGRLAIPLGKVAAEISSQPAPRPVDPARVTNTVEETHRLLDEGLSIAEIAAQRGMQEGTIYNHLASLIGQGTVPVSRIVPDEKRLPIESAVEEVGSFYLTAIKARLPEEISYGEIRCVVAAMQREGRKAEAPSPPAEQSLLLERLTAWRKEAARQNNQPGYFILSNTVLNGIAQQRPTTRAALAAIPGMETGKIEQYGEQILALVAEASGSKSAAPSSPPQRLYSLPTAGDGAASLSVTRGSAPPDDERAQKLREWRRDVADRSGVPAFQVLNNATLEAIVAHSPRTLDEFRQIPGIGPDKTTRYGDEIIQLLRGA